MDRPEHDFGRAVSIDADAVGPPGQRRFRLMVRSDHETASIWMEKTQLAGIATWFAEVREKLDREHPTNEPDVEPTPFSDPFDVDFRASQLGLGYVEDEDVFAIQAFDAATMADTQLPSFRCFLSRGQSRVLGRKIVALVAAGRPICPLCELPMDPEGHVCPRSNGHYANLTI